MAAARARRGGAVIAVAVAVAGAVQARQLPQILDGLEHVEGPLEHHGVDADHIAAIDGVTRKLVAAGQRPMLVGLFFSLGHCVVVFAICGAIVLSTEVTGNFTVSGVNLLAEILSLQAAVAWRSSLF